MKSELRPLGWWVDSLRPGLNQAPVSPFHAAFLLPLQSSFVGAIAIGDLVKSTLGPKGMVGPGPALSKS